MKISYLASLTLVIFLSACGSSNDTAETPNTPEPADPVVTEGTIAGPFSTGSTGDPKTVYFDLDAGLVVDLTDEQARNDSSWDVAFNRTKVSLNKHADNTVGMYFTAVNSDFFADDSSPIAEKFIAANAESELADYLAISASDIPADEAFTGDSEENVIGAKFYHYDMTTHVVSAADDQYFIVNSDDAFTKFRVKALTTAGRTMSSITLGVQHQSALDGQTEFSAETDLVIDTSQCSDDIYVDFDLGASLSLNDAWDITLPCVTIDDVTGANFSIHIAPDATALRDTENTYTGIDSQALAFYGFVPDVTEQLAFDSAPWYQYGLDGGHLLWSQYGVYVIKTNTAYYKLQITSYYDEVGTSGNYSFRFDPLATQ
ncbi:MAG: HmuY family protein [Paraglaciecola sp.]|uniref:HmuY family protein n=1 Tax=Paraglaciecola sp. TaxID=1920173 RepID=UPI00273D86A0|nr:HmuY family protein [Paraglaciecola sp.]MDP5029638.1 HmuY family protein [Paraglaciecola sp.]MDP5133232.1 HmuY family protein [Paraglaciecola sp.]